MVKVQERDMVCSVGMSGVIKRQAALQGDQKEANYPEIKEPVPHLRFGEKIRIGAPLPQPALKVTLVVDWTIRVC